MSGLPPGAAWWRDDFPSGVPALGLGYLRMNTGVPCRRWRYHPFILGRGRNSGAVIGTGGVFPLRSSLLVAAEAARSDPFGTVASNSRAAKPITYSFARDCIIARRL